jgi:hypothetical protein
VSEFWINEILLLFPRTPVWDSGQLSNHLPRAVSILHRKVITNGKSALFFGSWNWYLEMARFSSPGWWRDVWVIFPVLSVSSPSSKHGHHPRLIYLFGSLGWFQVCPSLNGGKRETFSAAFHNNFPPLTDSVPNQTQPNVFILFIQLLASYSFSLQLGDDLELFCIFPFINNNYQFCLLSPSQPKEKSCLKVADFVFPRLIPNSFFVMWRMEPGLHVCQGSTLNYTPTPKFTFIKMYALSVDFL